MSVEVAQPRSSTRSSPNVPPIDLRHMTSATVLGPGDNRRASQHLQPTVRKGSRSPSSIPSSPTSVHSSSSAIFERDIEPIHISPSAPLGPGGAKKDPHRIPRSKNTETLEQSVPSVLDSAASILASMSGEDSDSIAVIAPAPLSSSSLLEQAGTARSRLSGSGFASPIGSFRSRSPSPSARSGGNRNSLLLNIPPSNVLPHQHVATPVPSISPPASASASAPSPTSAPPTARQFDVAPVTPMGDSAHNTGTARAPSSTTSAANKRLSFVSYTDLLSSTPTTTQPLSTLTSPASSPSHISGVSFAADPSTAPNSAYGGSGAPSLRNFGFGLGDEDRMMDDVGGEWEREGLGKGLEERLEALAGFGMS